MRHWARRMAIAGLGSLLVAPLWAGVVYEIDVTDHEGSEPSTHSMEVMAEGGNLKMEIAPGEKNDRGDMIFRSGERREMVVVDHNDKSYMVMDEATIRAIGGQISQAMKQVEQALESVPEGQREQMRKLFEERMPKAAAATRPQKELRKTSERAEKAGYPCVKYEVWQDGRKVRELWVTGWDRVEGREAADAFEEMSAFFQEMMDAFSSAGGPLGGGMDDNFYEFMKDLEGFPVVTNEFGEDGSLDSESTLRSFEERDLDPDAFEPPSGYRLRTMGPQ